MNKIIVNMLQQLTEKKKKLDNFKPFPIELVENLDEWYKIELTYTSNAIEGNTLTRQETAIVVEKGLTVEGKTLNEHLEAVNHAKAVSFIKKLLADKKTRKEITESDILEIHRIILSGINDAYAGRYRNIAVRIAGSRVVLPNPVRVPELMEDFMEWLRGDNQEHTIKIAADAHFKLVSIHPFVDGNGRTARLLMNLLLTQEGYPPAIIKTENRKFYINAIEKGQLTGSMDDYYKIIYEAVDKSLDIYLDALEKSR